MSIAAIVGLLDHHSVSPPASTTALSLSIVSNDVDQTFLLTSSSWTPRGRASGCGSDGITVKRQHRHRQSGSRSTFPPQPEQRRIAEALRTSDEQIEALKRLIAKKEAFKQGTMQHLLPRRSKSR